MPLTLQGPVPPLAGHTMTVVMATKVWLIGGFSSSQYFNPVDYEFDASTLAWSQLGYDGVKPTGALLTLI